ncbi:MAG: zf-HC2 domain-containing protein [bacterium]
MNACKNFEQDVVFYLYDELSEIEKADLEAHLQACATCQAELESLRAFHAAVPAKPLIEPEEASLQVLRNAVSLKIRNQQKSQEKHGWRLFSFVQPSPAFQFGFAVLLLAFGFLLGRQTFSSRPAPQNDLSLESLITASHQIQAVNSKIDPFLAGVEKLKFDPNTGMVEIHYNTVNDIALTGDLSNPMVRQMLRHAIVDEQNPAVRLHAVKAIGGMLPEETMLESDLVEALTWLLQNEQNKGVKLQTLRVLKALPLTTEIKNIFVRVLFYDKDTAMRIEAFKALSNERITGEDTDILLRAAEKDTSGYIKYRAEKMLQEIQEPFSEINGQSSPMELRREK